MKIITVFVPVFVDEEVDPVEDCLCDVISITNQTVRLNQDNFKQDEEFLAIYCMNPQTGEVTVSKLIDVTINSYINENKETIVVSSPKRITKKGDDN